MTGQQKPPMWLRLLRWRPLSWQIWRLLLFPPRKHPLYWIVLNADTQPFRVKFLTEMSGGFVVVLLLAVFATVFISPLAFLLIILPMLFVFFNGSLYGMGWSYNITREVQTRLRGSTDELLRVTPLGGIAAAFALCAGYIYRRREFPRLNMQRSTMLILLLILPALTASVAVISLLFGLFAGGAMAELGGTLALTAILLVFALGLHIDHIQTVALACLLSISLPKILNTRFDAQIIVPVLFVFVQALIYLWLLFLLTTLTRLDIQQTLNALLVMGIGLVLFALPREIIMQVLWRVLLHITDGDPDDLYRTRLLHGFSYRSMDAPHPVSSEDNQA